MYSRRVPSKKISPLDKKIKPNPKYASVESVVNSGNNLRKELERIEEIRTFYKFRSDEIFRRIKITSLVRLMVEVAKVEIQERDLCSYENGEHQIENSRNDSRLELASSHIDGELIPSVVDHRKQITTRIRADLLSSVGDLMSERDFEESSHPISVRNPSEDKYNRPFLILDVRNENDFYKDGAIIHSESYPLSKLTRSVNFESHSMLRFKIPGKRKIIVVVDEDESLSSKMATTLVERGYTNIFLLSGGLKVARILFPEKLIGHFTEESNCLSSQHEGDILYLENLCDEASTRGRSSRLSSYAPSRASVSLTRSNRSIDRFNGLY